MKSIVVSMALAGMVVSGSAFATEMPELADKMFCTACHTIDKKSNGPTWQDIANRYKGDAGAAAALQVKISKGGSGNWGNLAMPAIDAAGTKQAEIKELVDFILGLAN
jgi:cytochrome c